MTILSPCKRSNLQMVDRISELPDHLLCRILAFLPTTSAMATSVLSRRWEYVWTGVPVLNFTYDDGVILYDFSSIAAARQYQSLKYYMNRVLLHNSAVCLERVDFKIFPVMTEKDRQEWFKVLSRRLVNEVNLFYEQCCTVPIMILLDGILGKHLVVLRLECKHGYILDVAFTSRVHLPCLEKVHLLRVEISDSEPLTSLIRSSPRLRELILEFDGVINFSCSTLKILKMSAIALIRGSIRVPNLEYFELNNLDEFHSDDDCRFLTGDIPYLAEAKIECHLNVAMWGDLFQTIRHVINLDISIYPCTETMDCALQENTTVQLKLPYFDRLKRLEIHCYEEHTIRQTKMFLRHMPNCVSLIIHMRSAWWSNSAEMKGWPEVDSVGLESQVEYIEINGFGPNRLVSVELLKYLLVCCTRLKEMKLHMCEYWENAKQKNAMRKTIMRISRPYTCKIVIDDRSSELM